MSIWTQAEYDSLKAAYLTLLKGEKVAQASIGGKFIRYNDSQLSEVRETLDIMAAELGHITSRAYAKPVGRFT